MITGDKSFITIDETLYDFSHGKVSVAKYEKLTDTPSFYIQIQVDFMTAMELMKFDIAVKVSNPIKSKEVSEKSSVRVLSEFEK